MSAQQTPSQTVGPFFAIGMPWGDGEVVVPEGATGRVRIHGYVIDGAGEPVPDAIVETWQADADGRFADPDDPRGAVQWTDFRGFGRSCVDDDGAWQVFTVVPGQLPAAHGGAGLQAPHLLVTVLARGLLDRVVTRIYFADREQANAVDPVLQTVPEGRRSTLLAQPDGEASYRLDIHFQGPRETVFFTL